MIHEGVPNKLRKFEHFFFYVIVYIFHSNLAYIFMGGVSFASFFKIASYMYNFDDVMSIGSS